LCQKQGGNGSNYFIAARNQPRGRAFPGNFCPFSPPFRMPPYGSLRLLTAHLTGPTSKKPFVYAGPNGLTAPHPWRRLAQATPCPPGTPRTSSSWASRRPARTRWLPFVSVASPRVWPRPRKLEVQAGDSERWVAPGLSKKSR
jgi:hypothetical protein